MSKKNNAVTQLRHTTEEAQSRGGEAPRNPVTERGNQTTTQPENPAVAAVDTDDDEGLTSLPVAHIGSGPSRSKTPNIFNQLAAEVSQQVEEKVAVMGSVRQRLAEARDYFAQGADKAQEATAIADKAAVALYQARVAGSISADEVSGVLGDIFGLKAKKDGTPGKTPDGQGEAIRKRIVRAVQAKQFVTGEDTSRFFEGLDEDDVSNIIGTLDDDGSIWTVYDKLAEMRRNNADRASLAFDHKRIASIVASLSEEGAASKVRANRNLIAAYGALIDVLNVIGEAAAQLEEAA